jgi:hypothetical protein
MATVIVSGDVKVSESRKQVILWETYDYSYKAEHGFVKKEAKRKWVIWFEGSHAIESGDWVEIEGSFSSRIGSWEKDGETKSVVDHVINEPVIRVHNPAIKTKIDLDDQAKYGNMPF